MRHRLWVLLLALAGVVHADYEETERRLKSAGVDAPLRKQIHEAIRRGVLWLAERQRRNGLIGPNEDYTAFCALALQHAAVPEAAEAYARCLKLMMPKGVLRSSLGRSVYGGAFATMVLHGEKRYPKTLRKLGAVFAFGEGKRGFWTYQNQPGGSSAGNLSTTQFGVLALWTAERAGYRADPGVWIRQLEYLTRYQQLDGSWGYGKIRQSYPTGTFMGLANLVLAQEALDRRPELRRTKKLKALLQRAAQARAHAERVLVRDVRAVLAGMRDGWLRDYYALYALEKACLFLDREKIGGIRWYVEGAKALIRAQEADGGWSKKDYRYWLYHGSTVGRNRVARMSSIEATAFAVLFLLRTWTTFHPTTPRDLVTGPTTPQADSVDQEPEPDAPKKVEPPDLQKLLPDLRKRLADSSATNEDLMAALRGTAEAYARTPDLIWRVQAEELWVRALLLQRVDRRRKQNLRTPVNVAAAEALGGARPAVSKVIRNAVDKTLVKRRTAVEEVLWEAVFRALARLNELRSLKWLADRYFLSVKASDDRRARAALLASIEFRDVPRELRHAIVQSLIRHYSGLEKPGAAPTGRWAVVGRGVIPALQHFAGGKDQLPPKARGVAGGWMVSMQEFRDWWPSHRDPEKAPWRD